MRVSGRAEAGLMMKRFTVLTVLLFAALGCTQCMLMRSEYYDLTGQVFTAKSPDYDIPVYEIGNAPEKQYTEIGAVKVVAQPNTTREAMKEELKKRGRLAGADALIEAQYTEDKTNTKWFCGRWGSTKHNVSATAKAVIFVGSK